MNPTLPVLNWEERDLLAAWASLVVQLEKHPPAMQETWVQSLGWEDPLEKGKLTHSSILAWRIADCAVHGGCKQTGTTEPLSLSLGMKRFYLTQGQGQCCGDCSITDRNMRILVSHLDPFSSAYYEGLNKMVYKFPYISNTDSKKSSNVILNSVGLIAVNCRNPQRQELISMSLNLATVLNTQS